MHPDRDWLVALADTQDIRRVTKTQVGTLRIVRYAELAANRMTRLW